MFKLKKNIVLILGFSLLTLQSYAQCAMCRAVLESGDDQAAAEGINDGIMFLMAVPYVLVAVIGYFIYRTYNTSKKS
ncbi:hypothetical protein [Winogradskyella sp.]|jgi:hypothetical protein|uniref:hypothetical protein n=1 Tax=Winogradskyella sp. TaxID=1883156 RepID=UPI0025FFAE88|nr:hypothetical protein [Winogradskyella sp.]MCT4630446.1 hypothetical protein [Winogradskyella sp.]